MIKKLIEVKKSLKEIKEGLQGVTERVALLVIVLGVWLFLDIFQNRLSSFYAVLSLLIIMTLYALYMQAAYKYKKRKAKKHPVILNENYKPFVSIMIPCHNEQNVIKDTVEKVLKIEYPNYEVIVIDDRSDDNTASVLIELEKKYDNVKVLIREKDAFPGKSIVLNEAMNYAKGDAILVFDADAYIERDFLCKLVPFLEPHDIGAVQARKVIINREENFLTRCQDNEYALDTHFQVGRDAVKGAVELRGNGELIKRKALEDINGWNNYTITDDLDMSTRLQIKGWDIRFCPGICVYEEGISNIFALYRQRRRWVEGSIRRYLENIRPILFSKDMSIRTGVDLIAYLTEVILPFMAVSEFLLQMGRSLLHYSNTFPASIILGGVICVFYMIGITYSIRRYNKLSRFQTIKQGLETSIYFIAVWFPLVLFIVFKILFGKKTMEWGKTTHGVKQKNINENAGYSVENLEFIK